VSRRFPLSASALVNIRLRHFLFRIVGNNDAVLCRHCYVASVRGNVVLSSPGENTESLRVTQGAEENIWRKYQDDEETLTWTYLYSS
jgi:hypothetical protein